MAEIYGAGLVPLVDLLTGGSEVPRLLPALTMRQK